ncbi:MAG: chromosome segregation protein SMC, partial [Hyphomicrobiales bacterium]
IPPADALTESLQRLRETVTNERAAYTEIKARFDGFERDAAMRSERLAALADERKAWSDRKEGAEAQITALEQRAKETTGELEQMADLPQLWQERREKLFRALDQAEQERKAAADALAEAETLSTQSTTKAREAEADLSMSRETHARNEERLNAARERIDEVTKRITERLECEPPKLREMAEIKDDAELPDADAVDARLARLRAERERLGGVNLRADEEAQEVGEQLDTLVSEREDLVSAIHRLRQGIASLNKEGRERLVAAFEKVNTHFEELFTALFGGGKASLEFVESDDPLEAGLEITARPPGKRTQVLSLLSGGEQALTAMALIFAVFLTNPSPICVLDECDAPLDDSNVERFCNLLYEMLKKADTRFLIITHHAYTMSQMHRLFGVTMAERGVSQLVSVDLETAESFREAS